MTLLKDIPVGFLTNDVTFNQDVKNLVPDDRIDGKYLAYSLTGSKHQILELVTVAGHGTGKLETESLKSLPVSLPPLPEQIQIATILCTWDDALSILTHLIDIKRQQKRALAEQLLTRKRRLKGFEGEWESVEIGAVLQQIKRPVDMVDDDSYEQLTVKRRSGGIVFRASLLGKETLTKKMNLAVDGDFLISKMQVVHGASALIRARESGKFYSDSYVTLIPKKPSCVDMNYFEHLSSQSEMYDMYSRSSYGVHIEKMTFNIQLYLKEKIYLPGFSEQQAIATVLSSLDTEIDLLTRQRVKVQEQKRGLMDLLLTGKVRAQVPETDKF